MIQLREIPADRGSVVPILDYLQSCEGRRWNAEDTAVVREHLEKVNRLCEEMVKAAKAGRIR